MNIIKIAVSIVSSVVFFPALAFNHNRILCESTKEEEKASINIAIIGGGIGGSASAYFARKLFGSRATIDVYEESDHVGGRVGVVEVAGKLYESGGSVIHPKNMYMQNFVQELGLTKLETLDSDSCVGIYDGANVLFHGSRWKLINLTRLLWRYGLDMFTIDDMVQTMMKSFSNIYSLQAEGKAYANVEDILSAMGGKEFVGLMHKTTGEELKRRGLKDLTIDEIATGIMRVNYGQDVTLNAFAGGVSLAGVEGGLWSVKGGNWKVCESLLSAAGATLFQETKVTQVTKVPGTNITRPSYTITTSMGKRNFYDIVIVAAPLASTDHFFPCSTCSNWPKAGSTKKFWQTVATFVQGEVNHKHFGYANEEDFPEGMLTTENRRNYFNSIGLQQPVQDRENTNIREKPVRKVFSRERLTQEQLQELFPVRNETETVVWLAYPDLKPGEYFTSFVLDDGVFYVNAIEHAASAMEMSCIGAKNAALLAYQYYGRLQKEAEQAQAKKKVIDEL